LEAAMAHLTAAFRELNTVREILDFRRVHEIHVVADTDWAELWLKPRLPRFKAAHPNTLFCINGVGDIPVRLGEADCEVWFGEPGGSGLEYQLFRDYLMPVSSPANTLRMSKRRTDEPLEGFPLLHLDCYNADPASIGWPEWVNKYGYRKSVAGRGIRYRRIIHALEAVYSNAGILVCGLALVLEELDRERLSLPFPISLGSWSGHAYHVAFRDSALRRNQTALFRDWLLREGKTTHEQLCQLTAAA
jgi:LysR family glycine cleavage system transcriptional activator